MPPQPAAPHRSTADGSLRSPWHHATFWIITAFALGLLIQRMCRYFPFMADDAFISLRYSQRLLQGHGLTWNNAERTEGYTNLLWVLLCAALGSFHIDLVTAARLLSVLCTLFAFAALVAYLLVHLSPQQRPIAAMASLIPFALSDPFAIWAIGGLEQPLLIALLAWTTFFLLRYLAIHRTSDLYPASVLLALLALTRADAILFTPLFGIALAIDALAGRREPREITRRRLTAAVLFTLPAALFFLAQLAFRRVYYQSWLPNTAYVKVSFTHHRLDTAITYVTTVLRMELPLYLLALLGIVLLVRAHQRSAAFLLSSVPLAFTIYIGAVGGDIFPGARLLLPVLLLLCFAAVNSARLAFDSLGNLRPAVCLPLLLCALATGSSRAFCLPATYERWEWDGKSLALALRASFQDKHPLLVADCAGAVPFFSQFDAIDPLGLNDRHIGRLHVLSRGQGFMGHELGDGHYILDHKPDIILFGVPEGSFKPLFYSDALIVSDPRFAEFYQPVHLHVLGDPFHLVENPFMDSDLYIRRVDSPLGVQTTGARVTVPAYFAHPLGRAVLNASVQHGIQLILPPDASAQLTGIALPPGRWIATTDGSSPAISPAIVDSTNATVTLTNQTPSELAIRNIYLTRIP
jgi:hypothetical protein